MRSIDEIKGELEQAEITESRLWEEHSSASRRVKSLKIELWSANHGITVGDKVVFGRRNKVGIVTNLIVRYSDVEPIVTLIKKDGHMSLVEQRVYSWDTIALYKD